MAKKATSARGEVVDFDLLRIKDEIMRKDPSREAIDRQRELEERKRRRYLRRKKAQESKGEQSTENKKKDEAKDK